MKVCVFTLGCKVNEVESAGIMATLENSGFAVTDKLCPADIYVLNTCAVTREAEKKSRQLIARAKKFNEKAEIYVLGCASEKSAADFEKRGVTGVFGARNKLKVSERIISDHGGIFKGECFPKQTKTRAFIKVEDGCNNFCSYCIIPYLRGRERSRSIDDILKEISQTSCKEIVINGINLSAYNNNGARLTDLIRALSGVGKRIRLGSLECNIIDKDFLAALKNLKDFAPQFHLSLQSGSDAVLKSMNRHYTREQYKEKCGLIYEVFPDAAITTDIIAGFCTETEEDFLSSLSLIEEVGLARVHAFAFSPREGTAAYKMKDLPPDIKNERLHRLIKAGEAAENRYINKFIGKTLNCLVEEREGDYFVGYSGNYIKIYLNENVNIGEIYAVTLEQKYKEGAYAHLS